MSITAKILAVLLLAQLAALAVVLGGDAAGSAASRGAALGTPFVTGFAASDVDRIEVKDDKGERLLLARSGDGWVVETASGYPARPEAATKLVERILGLKSVAVVATQKRSHATLEVSEGKALRDVRLVAKDGRELVRVLFGKASGGGAFMRRAGADDVHRSDGSVTWEISTAVSTFIDTQLTSFDKAQVRSFSIERKGATPTALERGTDDGWKVAGDAGFAAAKEKVDQVLEAAAHAWFVKPAAPKAAPEHGVDPAECTFRAKLADGAEVTLALGKPVPGTTNVYARKGGSEFVVEIAESTLGAIEKEAEFFRPPPPAPAPGAPTDAPPGVMPIGGAPPPGK